MHICTARGFNLHFVNIHERRNKPFKVNAEQSISDVGELRWWGSVLQSRVSAPVKGLEGLILRNQRDERARLVVLPATRKCIWRIQTVKSTLRGQCIATSARPHFSAPLRPSRRSRKRRLLPGRGGA